MRNLQQYPVTESEIVRILERIQIGPGQGVPGDVAFMVFRDILESAKSNPNWMKETFGSKPNYSIG